MKKKFLLPVLGVLCSNQVFGEQVKKLTDKEFIIKKNRNESLQGIQKPKSLIINSDDQKFIPYNFRFDDLSFDIKALPMTLDLINKEKKNRRLRHNLIRLGAGFIKRSKEKNSFNHIADVFLKKKIGNFSGHLIFRSTTPKMDWYGWKENLQLFTEYSGVDFFKPFFEFNQRWKDFEKQEESDKNSNPKRLLNSNLDFNLGCPFILEKVDFKPCIGFRHSNFTSKKGDNENKFEEKAFDLNCCFNFETIDNIKLSCDADIKNLYYDKKSKIYNWGESALKELGDDSDVTFVKATPKIGFVFNQIEITPKLCFDYCSNKKFVKSDNINCALGINAVYEFENKISVNFSYSGGVKPNTFKKVFKQNHWGEHQAVVASNNKWETAIKANTQISNFKFNAGFQVNSYDVLPRWIKTGSNKESSLGYIKDVIRYKLIGGSIYESDRFTTLVSASYSLFQHEEQNLNEYKDIDRYQVKCDVSYSFTERILMNLQAGFTNDRVLFGIGADYVFSDLLAFFGNYKNCFGNSKFVFGIYMTPDKWMEKDFNNQLV